MQCNITIFLCAFFTVHLIDLGVFAVSDERDLEIGTCFEDIIDDATVDFLISCRVIEEEFDARAVVLQSFQLK